MPDPSVTLTKEQQEAAKQWLVEKKAVLPCPACGNTNWTLVDQMGHLQMYAQGAFILGSGFPVLLLICTRCTFFRMHSAKLMGLTGEKEESQNVTVKAEGTVTNA